MKTSVIIFVLLLFLGSAFAQGELLNKRGKGVSGQAECARSNHRNVAGFGRSILSGRSD